jgi:hypothetical protein
MTNCCPNRELTVFCRFKLVHLFFFFFFWINLYSGIQFCHGSAGTPLGTHAIGQDSGLEESRKTICT